MMMGDMAKIPGVFLAEIGSFIVDDAMAWV